MYSTVKVVHLLALIFWIGPALGSWLVLRYSQASEGEEAKTTQLVYKVFFYTIMLEHVALLVLLLSGAWMALSYELWKLEWLQQKLWIIAVVIVPLELLDIWLGNWKIRRLIEKRNLTGVLDVTEQWFVNFYNTTFIYIALAVLPVMTFAIMWLAVAKAPF